MERFAERAAEKLVPNAKRIMADVHVSLRVAVDGVDGSGFFDWYTDVATVIGLIRLTSDQRPALDYTLRRSTVKPRFYRRWAGRLVENARRRTGQRPKSIPPERLNAIAAEMASLVRRFGRNGTYWESPADDAEFTDRTVINVFVEHVQQLRVEHGREPLTTTELVTLRRVCVLRLESLNPTVDNWRRLLKDSLQVSQDKAHK